MANPEPPRRRRRRGKLAAIAALVLLIALIATLPGMLGSAPMRRWLLARADRALAPGSVRCEAIRLSWWGPTRLSGVALIDPTGARVIAAPRATWDRTLFDILFRKDSPGTLTLDGASLDIERRADGSIDLIDALRAILKPNPRRDFRLKVVGGTLRFRSPGLAGPLEAERAGLDLHLPSGLRPLTWQLGLGDRTRHGPTLEIVGRAGRVPEAPGVPPDLDVAVTGRGWPLNVAAGGVDARGRFDGKAEARREAGRWRLSGDAHLLGLDAGGPALAGDRLQIDRVGGGWDLAETATGWAIDRLDLRSPLATLNGSGQIPSAPGSPARVEGDLDLVALARQLPHALRLREGLALERGSARLRIDGRREEGRIIWDVSARVSDLIARRDGRAIALREPATVSAFLVGRDGAIHLERLALKTPFLDVAGRGDTRRGITLAGEVDLGALRREAGDLIDLGPAELEGRGTVAADYRAGRSGYTGHLTLDLHDLSLGGLARREALHVAASATGPASDEGRPLGWSEGRLTVGAGAVALEAKAVANESAIDLTADGHGPVRLGDHAGRVAGRFVGSWWGDGLEIAEVSVGLEPEGDPAGAVALAARGRYDRAKGELTLTTDPKAKAGAVALAADGLRVSGLGRSAGGLRADASVIGDVNLLALSLRPWLGEPPEGLGGTLTLHASARSGADGLRLGGKVEAPELSWGREHHAAPALSAAWQAFRPAGADRLELLEVVLAGGYATLELSGRVDDLGGARAADIRGTLTPDWPAINRLLAERVEPGATAGGRPRAVRVKGRLSGASAEEVLRGLDAEIGISLDGAECFGMAIGPAEIVARAGAGGLAIDPIVSTLNGGKARVEPAIGRDAAGGVVLRLGPGSAIEDAQINDVVSRRVLAFVAPVLDAATRAHGTVSADVQRAEFPLGGDPARHAAVEGHVIFRDAEFLPGPLVVDLLHLVGRDDPQPIRLDEPVILSIADGRVHQRGLAVPLGRLTRLELDGSVGFDRTLDLRAALPITPALLGNNPLLGDIAAGTRVAVPIGGTLSAPKIDRDALNLAMKDLGKDLLQRGVGRGAAELLMRLARPRVPDPDAPPQPSPEERRAIREQRKADRIERRAERRREKMP